jgi:4-amino-4-deoxy-L-arabinose transferase-like glycosyltransferase
LLLLPWSVFLPLALAGLRFWQPRRWPCPQPEANPAGVPLFLGLWLALVVSFFSAAATKLPGYILPALPAGSLLLSLWFQPFAGGRPGPGGGLATRLAGWLQATLLALLAAAAVFSPRWAATDPAHPQFAAALRDSGLPPILAVLLALTALALVLLLSLRGNAAQRWLALPPLAGFLAILALVVPPLAGLIDRERQLPLRQLAQTARDQARPQEPLWVVGTKRYSTVFYAGEPAAFVGGRDGIKERRGSDPQALGLGPATRSVRLFGDRSDLEDLRLPPGQITCLARRGQQELWRVPLPYLPGP